MSLDASVSLSREHAQATSRGGSATLLFVVTLVLIMGAELLPSPAWAIAALAGFVALIVHLARWSPATLVLLSPLVVLRFTEYLAGVPISLGVYLPEISTSGSPTGAFPRLLLVTLVFFLTFAALLDRFWPKLAAPFRQPAAIWDRRGHISFLFVTAILIVATLYIAYLQLAYGLPLFTGEDRYHFRWRVDSPALRLFLNNRTIIAPFIGACFISDRYRKPGAIALAWLLILSLLLGEKFTSLVAIITTAIIPIGLHMAAHGRALPLGVFAKVGGGIAILTIPAILFAYGATKDLSEASTRFGERAAAQGELWFVTDRDDFALLRWRSGPLKADAATWLDTSKQDATKVGTKFGLYYVMDDTVRSQELRWIAETGNGYVFAQQPYLLKTMGYLGLILCTVFIALYHAVLLLAFSYALPRMDIVSLLLIGRISVFFYAFYVSGWFWSILGINTFLTIGALVLSLYFNRFRFDLR